MSDYLSTYFPEYAKSYPDTPAKRRAGMAAFRAKLLASHTKILAGMEAGTIAADADDIAFQRDTIATIKAAQQRLGEV